MMYPRVMLISVQQIVPTEESILRKCVTANAVSFYLKLMPYGLFNFFPLQVIALYLLV